MNWELALAIYGFLLFALLFFGVAIGSVMGFVGIVGITIVGGTRFWLTIGDIAWNTLDSFTLVAVPLFVFMGEIIVRSGVSPRFYNGLTKLVGRIRGGLAQANIAGCAIFAAISGSSTATAMTIGVIALPETRKRGYSDDLTLGTLTGGGCLGILIPPSIPLVIYAATVQESLLDLFMAGVIPGILLALIFMAFVWIRVFISPELAPIAPVASKLEIILGLKDCIPIMLLIAAVIGGMYFGIVTPTEAGAVGCGLALLLSLQYRDMTFQSFVEALFSTIITTSVVLFIMMNSQILSYSLSTSGIGHQFAKMISDMNLGPFYLYICLILLYLILGMFIDGISMMLLTVPVLLPALMDAGYNLVWFGIAMVLFMELGQLTPPMGLNLFAIQSISGNVSLGRIAYSSLPYALMIIGFCLVIYAFPDIVLWLPSSVGH